MKSIDLSPKKSGADSLFRRYEPLGGAYDEMFEAQGQLRAQWHEFAELVDALGPRELNRRWEQASRLIHENGITYNVHGDGSRARRWELDALPLLMRSDQWSALEAGLAQRARLLNAILADLYGPQELLREGLLPAELVFGDANFLRPCHGWRVPSNRYLYLYAAHLARSPSGEWGVLADRTQTPVGSGYAVENRIVLSRMLPHVFHHCRVQRLAGFFMALRETLGGAAAVHRGSPHTVLLSPGPMSPTYFEDAYLARYLGYTLVEGEDLTVRDNRVFLKTLGGLHDVDVVLRRVLDHDCDPLELGGQGRAGVPGLTQAARRGNVVLANALGTAWVETPALMAFLPALAKRLLSEDLRLPSVPTWWCGHAESLKFVLAHLDQVVIRPASGLETVKPIVGSLLGKDERQELAARIKASPSRFVAQELIVRSTAPVWSQDALRPAHVALRAFAVASGDSYQVMPGALAHVSASSGTAGRSMFDGNGSKDVWVLADAPVEQVTLLQPPGTPIAPRRGGNDLPSRVADNLFWLGRHLERAEAAARLLRSMFTRMISESGPATMPDLTSLFRALTWEWTDPVGLYGIRPGESVTELQVLSFLYDAQHPASLRTILVALGQVASVVRDRISLDSWRILMRLEDDFHPGYPLGVVALADVLSMLNQMILNLTALSGVAMENMTRGPGWLFLDLGRRIERALSMISLLRSTLSSPAVNEHTLLEAILEIADSSMTYRNRYATNLQVVPLLDLLVVDETNPRSIGFQLAALAEHVNNVPRQQADGLLSTEQRLVISMLSTIQLADVAALDSVEDGGTRGELESLLGGLAEQLRDLASTISHKYLVHAGPARQMGDIHPG